jgi:hypothetical protein
MINKILFCLTFLILLSGCALVQSKEQAIEGHYEALVDLGHFDRVYSGFEDDVKNNNYKAPSYVSSYIREHPQILDSGLSSFSQESLGNSEQSIGINSAILVNLDRLKALEVMCVDCYYKAVQSYEKYFDLKIIDVQRNREVFQAKIDLEKQRRSDEYRQDYIDRQNAAKEEQALKQAYRVMLNDTLKNEPVLKAELNWSVNALNEMQLELRALKKDSPKRDTINSEISFLQKKINNISFRLNALEEERRYQAAKTEARQQAYYLESLEKQERALQWQKNKAFWDSLDRAMKQYRSNLNSPSFSSCNSFQGSINCTHY